MTFKTAYITRCEFCHSHGLKCNQTKPCSNCENNGVRCRPHVHGNTGKIRRFTRKPVGRWGFWCGFITATLFYLTLAMLCWGLATYSLVSHAIVWEKVGNITLEEVFITYFPQAFPALAAPLFIL